MQNTTNLNLKKPDQTDYVNIGDLNDNMDVLDEVVQETLTRVKGLNKVENTSDLDKPISRDTQEALNELEREVVGHRVDEMAHGIGEKIILNTVQKETIVGAINELADYIRTPGYAVATGTNSYTAILNPAPTSYKEGMGIVVKFINISTGSSTLNINNLGPKPIVKTDGAAFNKIKSNAVYTLRYNGTAFILQGDGSDEKEIADKFLNVIFQENYYISYVDDTYYYVVANTDTIGAQKILKSNLSVVSVIPRKKYSTGFYHNVKSYTPGLMTEIYTGSSPSQNSFAYDENGTLIKTWDNFWYFTFLNATSNRYYKIYNYLSNNLQIQEYDWNHNLLRTLAIFSEPYLAECIFVLTSNDTGCLSVFNSSNRSFKEFYFSNITNNVYQLKNNLSQSSLITNAFAIGIGG